MARLQEQLLKEKDLTAALEAGLKGKGGSVPNLATVDEKVSIDCAFKLVWPKSFLSCTK